ncbi:hypothetical protein DRJ17_00540 [Candidatus Woesearchaeota archaeon]|nr:MAG: hypothetical protein DRJ17_00540 [Candidatus Woesearchaeota archaeon]
MQEKTLLKLSIILTIVGVISLFIYVDILNPREIEIEQLKQNTDNVVTLEGTVINYKDYGKTAILKLAQPKTVEVFLFKKENISINKGEYVKVTGEVKKYAKGFEIVADSIER